MFAMIGTEKHIKERIEDAKWTWLRYLRMYSVDETEKVRVNAVMWKKRVIERLLVAV